jgi:Transposase DDE domain
MPHQGVGHCRENQQVLKGVLERLLPPELESVPRHGNAQLQSRWLAAVAVVCWGWTPSETLGERVAMACGVVGRLWKVDTTVTRQGLLKALAGGGLALAEMIIDHIAGTLPQLKGAWSCGGKVNVAVDGTKMKAPRTAANQQEFSAAAPSSKSGKQNRQRKKRTRRRRNYRRRADASKASSVQVLLTMFWHLKTGLPLRWTLAGARGSERRSVQETIDQLPTKARLIGDAEYVGYPLWSTIIASGRSFLFRVGSNITLLKNLGRYRRRDGYVYFWPEHVMKEGRPPLVLRLFAIHNGRKTLYLVTNEREMTEQEAADLYRQRWGIEVFFRSVKQSCQRSKLHCGVPQNVLAEAHWTLLGIWSALYLGKETLHAQGSPLQRLSPVKVMRAFAHTLLAIHLGAGRTDLLTESLAEALIADESHRTTSKRSRNYPRQKRHHECGSPRIIAPTTLQKQKARQLGL